MFEINAPRSSLESNRLDPNLKLARLAARLAICKCDNASYPIK